MPLQAKWNPPNRPDVGGNVLTFRAIAARGAGLEYAIPIRECDGRAVNLKLGRIATFVHGVTGQTH